MKVDVVKKTGGPKGRRGSNPLLGTSQNRFHRHTYIIERNAYTVKTSRHKRVICEKCDQQITVANIKKHINACRGIPPKSHISLSIEERKSIPDSCQACGKKFKNVYSAAGHRGHCKVLHPQIDINSKIGDRFGDARAWSKDKILKPLDQVLIENSTYSTGYVKKIVLKLALREYKCEICGITEWQGSSITLELDHINGKNRDHRIENIRLLCPNCHSQTDNFRGRNVNKNRTQISDELLKEALLSEPSIRKALIKVGLSPMGGNYQRCHELLLQINSGEQ